MGKNLHYSIINFFERRMSEHSAVRSVRRLPNDNEVIYEVVRDNFGDTVKIWLADQYWFGDADFLSRPSEIKRGDFILIARPEANPESAHDEDAGIAVGKIGILMGALNKRKMWTYVPPDPDRKKRSI